MKIIIPLSLFLPEIWFVSLWPRNLLFYKRHLLYCMQKVVCSKTSKILDKSSRMLRAEHKLAIHFFWRIWNCCAGCGIAGYIQIFVSGSFTLHFVQEFYPQGRINHKNWSCIPGHCPECVWDYIPSSFEAPKRPRDFLLASIKRAISNKRLKCKSYRWLKTHFLGWKPIFLEIVETPSNSSLLTQYNPDTIF